MGRWQGRSMRWVVGRGAATMGGGDGGVGVAELLGDATVVGATSTIGGSGVVSITGEAGS